jgi:hypothetical protein
MPVHAVRLESDHAEILACFFERCLAVWTDGNGLPRLEPNVRKVDLLTERIVVRLLPFSKIDAGLVPGRGMLEIILMSFRFSIRRASRVRATTRDSSEPIGKSLN